jgi:NAD+ kinase
MANVFNTVAIVGRFDDARVSEPMTALAGHLTKAGADVVGSDQLPQDFPARRIPATGIASEADLVVAVGGDGTLLYAAELVMEAGIPLLGVNRGRLGFLTDVSPAEMMHSLDEILAGNYSQESRLVLKACITSADGSIRVAMALNDIVLQRRDTGRILEFETRIAGRYVNSHSGDGLIVSTPTGSTAYALSCGGPIIEPMLDALVVVPICPHTLSDRPIVVPSNQDIDIIIYPRDGTNAAVSVDGRPVRDLRADDRLTVSESPHRISLIHPPGYDFYDILRSKLHWGRDSRDRNHGETD